MTNGKFVVSVGAAARVLLIAATVVSGSMCAEAQTLRFKETRPPDIELSFSGVNFLDSMTGMLIGERVLEDEKSAVFMTHDGGKTWHGDLGTVTGRLLGARLYDASTAYVVGAAGSVMKTIDGGATWNVQTSKALADLYDVDFVTPVLGWAVGQNRTTVTTSNGGLTWKVLTGGQPSGEVGEGAVTYVGVDFLDEATGFVVGAGQTGVIERTTDGGVTWEIVIDAEENLHDIFFMDTMRGWTVGKYGLLLATTDGGVTWERQDSDTEEDLYTISVGDADHIWLSGDYGTLAYSTDAGESWNLVGVQVKVFDRMKDLTRPVTGIAALGNESWAVTDMGRVLYFILE